MLCSVIARVDFKEVIVGESARRRKIVLFYVVSTNSAPIGIVVARHGVNLLS